MKKKACGLGRGFERAVASGLRGLVEQSKSQDPPTDWMDGQAYKELAAVLAQYYGQLGKRDYFPESRFTLDLLSQLQKIDLIIHVVSLILPVGKVFLDRSSVYWGLEKGGGSQLVQASSRSSPNFQPHTPLITHLAYLGWFLGKATPRQRFSRASMESFPTFCPLIFHKTDELRSKSTRFRREAKRSVHTRRPK